MANIANIAVTPHLPAPDLAIAIRDAVAAWYAAYIALASCSRFSLGKNRKAAFRAGACEARGAIALEFPFPSRDIARFAWRLERRRGWDRQGWRWFGERYAGVGFW